jgi:hypothetical protein
MKSCTSSSGRIYQRDIQRHRKRNADGGGAANACGEAVVWLQQMLENAPRTHLSTAPSNDGGHHDPGKNTFCSQRAFEKYQFSEKKTDFGQFLGAVLRTLGWVAFSPS